MPTRRVRSVDDRFDYHDPTAGFGGAPPARSALGLRLTLAVFGLLTCGAGAGALAWVGATAPAGIVAALALIAAIDVVVVVHRMRTEPTTRR